MGHIRDVLVSHGYNVTATDLIYRGVDDIKQDIVIVIVLTTLIPGSISMATFSLSV